ncbi:MAG TPA: c-type cytochrome [Sphingomicrobium sp.]|jgi:cytochrome c2|nr:c-type cytochrome [Sphingomicrobium sp.]
MLRSISTKASFAILAGVILLIAMIGIAYEYVHQRSRMREYAAAETGGDPRRGEAMFIQYGCGSCHAVKNVRNAVGSVGPPLDGIAVRTIIAGHLANKPENMEKWIRDPQQVSPGTAMPDLNVGEGDARDITAFLYTRAK